MQIKFLAVGQAPDYYAFNGEILTAYRGGESEEYDLSDFPEGGTFTSADPVDGVPAIRHVERDSEGLKVTLCQQVIAGQYPGEKANWRESPFFPAAEYDPSVCYAVPTGMEGIGDYEIVKGVDSAGGAGWTVRRVEAA